MHIENLRFFYEVAKAKSISTVAKSSHISQSALSQQLLKLEDSLNTKLFVRSNKGVTLTSEGEIVYKHCEVILNTYGKMLEEVMSSTLNESYITIDGVDILTSTIVPMALGKIKRSFSNHIIKIMSSDLNSNNILHNISDINISYTNYSNNSSIITKELYSDRIVFVGDPSFKKDTLTIKEFLKTSLVMIDDNTNFKELLSTALEEIGEDINKLDILFSADTYQSAIIGIKNTRSLTFLPLSVYNTIYKHQGYKIVEINDMFFPITMYINFEEQLYKREKVFITKLISTIKGFLKS